MRGRRDRLLLRARLKEAIRVFFNTRNFVEVDTPLITSAPIPEPHIDLFQIQCKKGGKRFLIPSPEPNMKRLMAETGLERIYQLGPVFRRGERGRLHNPEFTLLEWYEAGADYEGLMETCEALMRHIQSYLGLFLDADLEFHGKNVAFNESFHRITLREAFMRFAGVALEDVIERDQFETLFVEKVEPGLSTLGPVFIYDWPREHASLARLKAQDPMVAERVELFVAGVELANGFSELTDPVEQAERFKEAELKRRSMGCEPYPWPKRFLDSLEGLQPCAGMALGFDRLLMLFSGSQNIDQVLAFTWEDT